MAVNIKELVDKINDSPTMLVKVKIGGRDAPDTVIAKPAYYEDEREALLLVKKDEGTYQKLKDELKGVRTFNNKTWEKITMDYGKYRNTVSNFNYVRAIRGFVILGMNLSSHSSKSILEYLDSNPTEKTSYISSKIFVDYFFHLLNEINRFISNSP